MHPYEMQRQMRIRHTDDLLALKRGSLYHAINQLQRDGSIEPVETTRAGRRPERTVYRITPDGDDEFVGWLRELLSTPVPETSHLMAALAHVLQLDPRDARDQLQLRVVNLEARIASMHAVERGVAELYGRVLILEVEYARALVEAELAWVRALAGDLHSGKLDWSFENIKQHMLDLHATQPKYEVPDARPERPMANP